MNNKKINKILPSYLIEGGDSVKHYLQRELGIKDEKEIEKMIISDFNDVLLDITDISFTYLTEKGLNTDLIGSSRLKYYLYKNKDTINEKSFRVNLKKELKEEIQSFSDITQEFFNEFKIINENYKDFINEMELEVQKVLQKIDRNFIRYYKQIKSKDIDIDIGIAEQSIGKDKNLYSFITTDLVEYIREIEQLIKAKHKDKDIEIVNIFVASYGAITSWRIDDKYIQFDYLVVSELAFPKYFVDTIVSTFNFVFVYPIYMGNFDIKIFKNYKYNSYSTFRTKFITSVLSVLELLDYKTIWETLGRVRHSYKKINLSNYKEWVNEISIKMIELLKEEITLFNISQEYNVKEIKPITVSDFREIEENLKSLLNKFFSVFMWGILQIQEKDYLYHKIYITWLVYSYVVLNLIPEIKEKEVKEISIKESKSFNELYKELYKSQHLGKVGDLRRYDYNRLLLKIGNKIDKYKEEK